MCNSCHVIAFTSVIYVMVCTFVTILLISCSVLMLFSSGVFLLLFVSSSCFDGFLYVPVGLFLLSGSVFCSSVLCAFPAYASFVIPVCGFIQFLYSLLSFGINFLLLLVFVSPLSTFSYQSLFCSLVSKTQTCCAWVLL